MKSFIAFVSTILLIFSASTAFAFDYDAPACIFMKFSNDTRYQNIDIASELSDLVISKMLKGGKFYLRETRPIVQNMEAMLYDDKARELANAQQALTDGNFNTVFESSGFDPMQADSIATAEVGQIILPSITAEIGRQHGAQYLFQGTIINLGNGDFADKIEKASSVGSPGFYFYQKKSGIGIKVDLRLIKASTGEVIWKNTVTDSKETTLSQVGMFMFGTANLDSDMYYQIMEDVSQKIVDNLIADLNAGKLFIK